jgi:hypothetical protein
MRLLLDLAIAIAIATVLGFFSAWYAIDRGLVFGRITVSGWTAWPNAGSQSADPYSIAMLARTGEVPLGAGEGLAFRADADRSGHPLSGRCDYHVLGQTPGARLWTLTAYDGAGHLMTNAAHRQAFHSRELLRQPDGSFDIAVSTTVKPGNWLPIAPVDRFELVLRLYDTPVTTGSQLAALTMPQIVAERCG